MMQALLEDRLKLKIHRETREVPVYALTVAQGGSRLKPFEEGSCTNMPLTVPLPALAPGQAYCKVRVGIQRPAVDAQGSTLTEFSQLLDLVLDRPVIDMTGIPGKFDIHLEFAINEATPRFLPGGDLARFAGPASNAAAPSIFTAIQQLGLKLEATNGPSEFLVIDHVERPIVNLLQFLLRRFLRLLLCRRERPATDRQGPTCEHGSNPPARSGWAPR
jgi:uncharacterized protein (TIGR03435 family)